MKVAPLASSPGTLAQAELGRSVNPARVERAKAIAAGQTPVESTGDAQADKVKQNVRSIKMKTQVSTNRDVPILEEAAPPASAAPAEVVSSNPESTEQATVEATQPLSPQFAALAKQKRAFQLEKAQFDKEKADYNASKASTEGTEAFVSRLKSEPLRVLLENGVTYDQLTEAILSEQSGYNPEIQTLKEEIKALKEGFDKTLGDRDTQAEQAALAEMRKEADRLILDDSFELVRETRSVPKVIDLIHRTYKESGEILDVQEALQLVEDDLLQENLRIASLKKVQSKITPPSPIPLQPQPPERQMKTLTARDTAAPLMDRKARAIAAAMGTLKR